ncbi:hypothetical protein HDE_10789 [Halotydeus destructor]|nr:hypothetical protein HDE_10789 [Halotydeus destructor]
MKPDKKKYESHVYTHPDLGITLTFQLTMQINVGVDVTMFNDKMKPVVLPVSYFVVKSGISKTSTRKLWMGTTLNDTVTWCLSGVTVVIGILVMIAAYLMTDDIQNVRRRPRDSINFPSFSESGTFRAQVDSKL